MENIQGYCVAKKSCSFEKMSTMKIGKDFLRSIKDLENVYIYRWSMDKQKQTVKENNAKEAKIEKIYESKRKIFDR